MAFSYRLEKRGPADVVYFTGVVDAEAGLKFLRLYELPCPTCIFNFKDVKHMNSAGVGAWIGFIRTFGEDHAILFEHCSPAVVSQIGMVGSFLGKAQITSVYARYRCDSCNSEKVRLIEGKRHDHDTLNATRASASCRCDQCGAEMAVDDQDALDTVLERLLPRR